MKSHSVIILMLILLGQLINAQTAEEKYTKFDDRKITTHGVYLGITTHYGEIHGKNTYLAGGKVAYVANEKFEVGFAGVGFYSEQEFRALPGNSDIFGGYGGVHIEPYLYSISKLKLSAPLLVGVGATAFTNNSIADTIEYGDSYVEDWDAFFVAEPGLNLLYQISRFVQLEAGLRYRLSSRVDMIPDFIENINGFSGGIGVKIGVFDLGRNRNKSK